MVDEEGEDEEAMKRLTAMSAGALEVGLCKASQSGIPDLGKVGIREAL